jgi:hypothetical protein
MAAKKKKVAKKKQTKAKKEPKKDKISAASRRKGMSELPATKIGEANGISTGRPKGAKNKTTLVKEAVKGHWDELMVSKARDVFNKAVEMALEGDTQCIKMIMDRAVPVSKAVDINASDIGKTGGITIVIEQLVTEPKKGDVIEDGGAKQQPDIPTLTVQGTMKPVQKESVSKMGLKTTVKNNRGNI